MKRRFRVSVFGRALALGLLLLVSMGRSQDLVISELMATNDSVLQDEDLKTTDWLEIYNPGETAVNLGGWFLTDDPQKPAKWEFPERELGPGKFLVVFASEKNRRNPAGELHTNFKLAAEGEFLALVRPDGSTAASAFAPRYPRQKTDVAYGLKMQSSYTPTVPAGASGRYLVPLDGALGLDWTATDFDDSAWKPATMGIGYDRKTTRTFEPEIATDIEADLYNVGTSVYVRIPFDLEDLSKFDVLLLKIKYDDAFVAYLNGVEIARDNVPAEVIWSSRAALNRSDAAALAHVTINISAHAKELRAGRNVLAIHALNSTKTNTDLLLHPEIETGTVEGVDRAVAQYFVEATPGLPNREGFPGVVEAPAASKDSSTFVETFNVELASATADAAIRYTIDRRDPTEASPLYEGPISIARTTVVKARAFKPGLVPSPTAVFVYVGVDQSLANFDSNLPLIVLSSQGAPGGDAYLPMDIVFLESLTGRTKIIEEPAFIGQGIVKRRGSSSAGWPKGNYGFEIQDPRGNGEDVSIFGMPAESDWVLHGPYSDKSLMRNALAFGWSNKIGVYAPRTRFCELFLDTTRGAKFTMTHYAGTYVLMEKIKRGDDRVDVNRLYPSELSEPDISGGWVLKKDRADPGDAGFPVPAGAGFAGQQILYVDPKERGPGAAAPQQKAWLTRWFQDFARALGGPDFADPEKGYAKFIDVPSFIDHHIITELCKNIDGYRLSTYMFKDKEGKLNMGPLWDFNLSLRNADYLEGGNPIGWYYRLVSAGDYPWYPRLQTDPNFNRLYSERWSELRSDEFTVDGLLRDIDNNAAVLAESAVRNYQKWRTLGIYLWPNPPPLARTWQEEVDLMKDWLRRRVLWMDTQLIAAPRISPNGGDITENLQVTIEGPAGLVYYTVDGSDPLGADGKRSAAALQYAAPIPISSNTVLKARILPELVGGGALSTAYFLKDVPRLVISELHYNPLAPPEGSPYVNTDFEFVEVHNAGGVPVSLQDVRLARGVTFDFTSGSVPSLAPGEYAVVVRNLEAFATRYDASSIKIAGVFGNSLANGGEELELLGPVGESVDDFTYARFRYSNAWHPSTAQDGYSLVLASPDVSRDLLNEAASWRPSVRIGGSPGRADDDTGPSQGRQIAGDITQDGRLNLTDAVNLLSYLFQGAVELLPCEGGVAGEGNAILLDLNGDQNVNLSDPLYALNYLFQGGAPPALGIECVPISGCPNVCEAPGP